MFESSSRRAIIAAAALAFVAGCSGSTGSLGPGQTSSSNSVLVGMRYIQGAAVERPLLVPSVPRPWALPHAWPMKKKQILFVADPQNNQILMYNPKVPNPSPEGSITNGLDYTFGIAVNKKGTLYAANLLGGSTGSIAIYPKGSSSPSLTITNGCNAPYGIGVDSKGEIFIANLNNNTIVGYKDGATSPFETIDFSPYGQALGIGIDSKDNIWIGSDTTSRVYEIPAGSSTPQNAGLSGLNGTIGVAFGKKNEMYVSNFGSDNVQVYDYGTTSPKRTITNGLTAPTFGGLTKSDYYFQSNQGGNVVGYKKGQSTVFSTITGIPDPRGIASIPLVKK
jgi:streptogramin lyase